MADVQADTHTCGHPAEESFHPDSEGAYGEVTMSRCHACTAIERKREKLRKAEISQPGALTFTAHRRDESR